MRIRVARLFQTAVLSGVAATALALPAFAQSGAPTLPPRTAPMPAAVAPHIDAAADADPYLWLEDVNGPRAMAWVNKENTRSLAVLEADPRYAAFREEALAIAEAKDRIPAPEQLAGEIYNFWQDADHVRGIWRAASLSSYQTDAPDWRTVLDIDQLAKAETANWVFKGATCEHTSERVCMVALSDGGEDAVTLREFDLAAGRFVESGFKLSHSKQSVAWIDEDALLIARDWGQDASGVHSLTTSGYPYIVKVLRRGQGLGEAQEAFRGARTDVSVDPVTLTDGQGHKAVLIVRGVSFFESEIYLLTPKSVVQLALPRKAQVSELAAGRLIVSLKQDWRPTPGGRVFPQGSVVSLDLAQVRADPDHLVPTLVWAPGPRESLDAVSATRDRLILTAYDNVRGRAYVFNPTKDGWTSSPLDLPDNASISIASTDPHDDTAFLSVTSFLAPTTLWVADAWTGALKQVKATPPKFDATGLVTEQFEATSKDGTKIPYFVVHRKDMAYDGSNPTLLYAYGGFEASMTPNYSGTMGKLWLERGGVYVLANIRGGGEFGPAWHEAGLTVHRQRIYDDFAAVAQDLIAKKITSPRRLGIEGGSNGGLLMGVEFEQHPELWNAVVIQVPLLDMLRFEQIAAGASWVGEYGSVSNPEQRAFLASISPYHNLRAGVTYPEPYIFTTTKDDRVGPVHARKFAAKMEAMGLPFFYYENTEGGHAAGANLKERAREAALEMTYLTRKLMN
jgi:prolyl oligopeptidase